MKNDISICFLGDKLTVRGNAGKGKIAYRLYRNNELIEKKGYVDLDKICVFKILFSEDIFRIRVYKREGLVVKKFWTDEFYLRGVQKKIGNEIVEKLYLKQFEIKSIKNVNNEIDRYKKSGFLPMGRKDLTPVLLDFPIEWHKDVFKDRNWMFQFHAWRMLEPFFQRFLPEDVDYISEVINDWSVAEESSKKKEWFWYDMSVGLRAFKLAYLILNCEINKISHKVNNIERLIEKHIACLANPAALNSGNHGVFQINGLMSLIWAMKVSFQVNFEKEKRYALKTMVDLLRRQLGKHGVHTENSPEYHFFVLGKIVGLLSTSWWKDESLGDINGLLTKAEIVKSWLVDPAHRCVPVGDSGSPVMSGDISSIFDWPHESSLDSIGAVLDGYGVVRTRPDQSLDKSHFLFFQASFYSNVHKHADCLSFILQEKGRGILIDSGKYGYKSDRFRSYFLSSYAHNTVTIDGMSFSKIKRNPYGSALVGGVRYISGYWIMRGEVEHKELGYSHYRTIVYKPGVDLYVIDFLRNDSKEKKARIVEVVWNFDSRFSVACENQMVKGVDGETHEIFVMDCIDENGRVPFSIDRGVDKDGVLRGWASPSYLVYKPIFSAIAQTTLQTKNVLVTRISLTNSDSRLITIQNGVVFCSKTEIYKNIL